MGDEEHSLRREPFLHRVDAKHSEFLVRQRTEVVQDAFLAGSSIRIPSASSVRYSPNRLIRFSRWGIIGGNGTSRRAQCAGLLKLEVPSRSLFGPMLSQD